MSGVGETCPCVIVLSPEWERGETNSSVAEARLVPCWYRLQHLPHEWCPCDTMLGKCSFFFFFFLEEKCCFCYSSQQVCFQVLHEISRASPSQPMQPVICSWPLWGEVIRRKFLFSCICFPTQPCCFINFTGLDMCFKSDLRYVRKSSHSTDLSKHCWLTGTRSFPLHAGLQKQADVCAQQPHAPGGGAAQSPSCLQSSVKNNNKIEMLLSALKSTSRLLLIKK